MLFSSPQTGRYQGKHVDDDTIFIITSKHVIQLNNPHSFVVNTLGIKLKTLQLILLARLASLVVKWLL